MSLLIAYHGSCLSCHDLHKSGDAWYITTSLTIQHSSRPFHFSFVVTGVLLWGLLCFCSGAVEVWDVVASHWVTGAHCSETVLCVSTSGVKISIQISSCFSMNILTLADETTMLFQNVRLQPSNDTAPHPQTKETSVGGILISHNHLFFELIKWPSFFGSQLAHCSSITHTPQWVSNSDRIIPVIGWQCDF